MPGTIMVEVPEELIKKGLLEIVTRQRGRYKDFIKIAVDNSKSPNKNLVRNLVNQLYSSDGMQNSVANTLKLNNPADIHRTIAQLGKAKNVNPQAIQMLAIKATEMYAQSAAIAAWAGAALSAAGLAATVISTVVICKKLDQISKQIEKIDAKIDQVLKNDFDHMIYMPSKKLISDNKVLAGNAARGKQLDEDALVEKITDAYNLLDYTIDNIVRFGVDEILTVIFSLLPAYTNLIVLYYENFFNADYPLHQSHEDWMFIFDRLLGEDFQQLVCDNLILAKHAHNNELNELLDLQKVTIQGLRGKIETTLEDLKACGTIEDYRQVCILATQYATEEARELQSALAKEVGVDEAKNIVLPVNAVLAIETV